MDRNEVLDHFLGQVSYELYPFQEEALLAWFESEGGVLITAPTGMGKTLIAEAAIYEALCTRQRLYYTCPLIALTDQKFREFQDRAVSWGFKAEEIGLITGNRRVNPDALVRVVVAEILLNHLFSGSHELDNVSGVVMDEFHYFNDYDRGIVWELSLMLLPHTIRLMLLSATVGNPVEFVRWMSKEHQRKLQLVNTDQRRVPLEYQWVGDRLLTEHLPRMVSEQDRENRSPALVFCFNRDECWEVAERLKGLKLINKQTREQIEQRLDAVELTDGIGPKLRQMLIRGVGVHHAGVLPKYKEIIESLFLDKLIPFVICTETLAAGVNLPARSVVLSTLIKGKPREKKLIAPSNAHQMFGRAGRPQFDDRGYVYVLAHEDDIKIAKWRKKYDQLDPKSKDPGILRAKKQLERKRPTRRKTEQYWTDGQFKTLINAKPAPLASRSMISYQALTYLLTSRGTIDEVRAFLSKRFDTAERLLRFQNQLDHMISNLTKFGFLSELDANGHAEFSDSIHELLAFRSIDPLYGSFLVPKLARASFEEKFQTLESLLIMPPAIARRVPFPEMDLEPGPLQLEVLEGELIRRGLAMVHEEQGLVAVREDEPVDYWVDDDDEPQSLRVPEMLKMLFDALLEVPEDIPIQAKWVFGSLLDFQGDFHKFTRAHNLQKNEGLILRHLLRMVVLAGEFSARSDGDPDYERIIEWATDICRHVDTRFTKKYLADEQRKRIEAT